MAVDWSLGQQPDFIGNALAGFQRGRQMRREETSRNALNALLRGPAKTPGTPGIGDGIPGNQPAGGVTVPWGDLTPQDRQTALSFLKYNQDQQAAQQKQQQTQMVQLGRLLDYAKDEQTYQQARQAAQQIGIDVSKAPANFDPAWVQQQRMVLSAFEKDGGQQISGLARELQDAGYQPGTPAFQQALKMALEGKYAGTYTDDKGNVRQKQLPALPQPGQPAGAPAVGTIEDGHRFKGGNPADPNAWEPVAQSQPQMVVTPRELDALVRQFGPDEVQRRLDSGVVAVRN